MQVKSFAFANLLLPIKMINAEYVFADDNNEENQENDLKSACDHEDSDEEGVQPSRVQKTVGGVVGSLETSRKWRPLCANKTLLPRKEL